MHFVNPIITDSLIESVVDNIPARTHGIHGMPHWIRVERNALYLAAVTGADPSVVSLFALFHDCRRVNDDADPGHGARGAELARAFHKGGRLPISEEQLSELMHACEHHTDEHFTDNTTIACCWDADRLDLKRLGIMPEPELLNTSAAKSIATSYDYSPIEQAEFEFNRAES